MYWHAGVYVEQLGCMDMLRMFVGLFGCSNFLQVGVSSGCSDFLGCVFFVVVFFFRDCLDVY